MYTALLIAAASLPAAFAATIQVSVGANGKLAYDPEFVNAAVGDIVNFTFNPKNHTVTQSSFEAPCVPLQGGINSGFFDVASDDQYLPTFQIRVHDTQPVWIHCEQTGHCGKGMVFAINPPAESSDKCFNKFKEAAMKNNGPPVSSSVIAPAETSTPAATGYPISKSSSVQAVSSSIKSTTAGNPVATASAYSYELSSYAVSSSSRPVYSASSSISHSSSASSPSASLHSTSSVNHEVTTKSTSYSSIHTSEPVISSSAVSTSSSSSRPYPISVSSQVVSDVYPSPSASKY